MLHAAANIGVALTFLATLLLSWRSASLPAWISIVYVVMALLSLVRAAPREARTDYQAWIALSGMVILPLLIQPLPRSAALTLPTPAGMAAVALVFQSSGLVLMQVADLCLGRHFGLLPANRGLVLSQIMRQSATRQSLNCCTQTPPLEAHSAAPTLKNFYKKSWTANSGIPVRDALRFSGRLC